MLKYLVLLLCTSNLFFACQSPVKNVTTIMLDDTQITVCDASEMDDAVEARLRD